MEQRKRILIFTTFFTCTACLALLTTSLSTHRWVVAHPIRILPPSAANASAYQFLMQPKFRQSRQFQELQALDPQAERKFRGQIYFGLFQGTKVLNYGLGDRTAIIWLKQEMLRNPNLMTFGLWLLTILSISIAMIFGLVGAIFSIINTVMTPIETITGVQGLYLWNGLASLFCACASITWTVQYMENIRINIMTDEERQDGWTSRGRTRLGYSYYLVLASFLVYVFNIALIYIANRTTRSRQNNRPIMDKHPEGLIMLY